MFTKKDIEILKGMFLENNAILRLEMRDEMHALIIASENRLRKDIHQVREGVVELIDSTILPQIADFAARRRESQTTHRTSLTKQRGAS